MQVRDFSDLVWIQTAFLGDIVLTTAAVELARRAFPDVRQHVVTTPLGAKALAGLPALTSLVAFDKRGKPGLGGIRDVAHRLREHMPAAARPWTLQVHRSLRSSLLARVLGWPTITYRETVLGCHARHRVARVALLHEAARIGLLLEPLGIERHDIVAARPKLMPLPFRDDIAWQRRLATWSGPVIGVAPGSAWGTKRWLPGAYAALVRRLLEDPAALVVLIGADTERALTAEVLEAVGLNERVLDVAGKTDLDDLRRLFPRLSLMVCNDSSPLQYASAFDTPTVAIFGATVPGMGFGPLATRSATPGVDLPCRPCSAHGPETCPLGHFRCMRDLTVDQVYAACRSVMAG